MFSELERVSFFLLKKLTEKEPDSILTKMRKKDAAIRRAKEAEKDETRT